MFGAGIDAQVTHLLAPQRPARDHALDRLFEHALGEAAFEHLAGGDALDAARIAGVPVIDLARQLVAGEAHLVRVDDDDVVTAIDVRGEARRSEEKTYELQSLMSLSYSVFCLKKKNY